MPGYLALIVSIVLEVTGTSFLVASRGFSRLLQGGLAVAAWVASVVFFSQALRTVPVGAAYAVWSGVGTVLITAVGVTVFRQKLDAPAVVGTALILVGVAVLRLFSRVQIG